MIKLAESIVKNINNPDELFKIFTENSINSVFVTYKKTDKPQCCNIERYYNWGYNGKMEYWSVAYRDKYRENAWLIEPDSISGIYKIEIDKSGDYPIEFSFKNGVLKEIK